MWTVRTFAVSRTVSSAWWEKKEEVEYTRPHGADRDSKLAVMLNDNNQPVEIVVQDGFRRPSRCLGRTVNLSSSRFPTHDIKVKRVLRNGRLRVNVNRAV